MKRTQSGVRSPSLRELLNAQQDSFQRALGGDKVQLVPRPAHTFPKQEPVKSGGDRASKPPTEKRD